MKKKGINFISYVFIGIMLIGFSAGNSTGKDMPLPAINPANFTSPMDNDFMPMVLGKTYVYRSEADGEVTTGHTNFSYDKKEILGVDCVVVYDNEEVYVEDLGQSFPTEQTQDWYAWDNYGNVWYFGESTVANIYDDQWNLIGTSTEGSWEGGVDGAIPGIVMLADNTPGIAYQQEYLEGVAEDMAKILRLNADVSVEYGDFDNCLVTKEWTPLSPGDVEHKYYAKGVGLVYIEEIKGKTETTELVDIY
jgi:hypothetical protein